VVARSRTAQGSRPPVCWTSRVTTAASKIGARFPSTRGFAAALRRCENPVAACWSALHLISLTPNMLMRVAWVLILLPIGCSSTVVSTGTSSSGGGSPSTGATSGAGGIGGSSGKGGTGMGAGAGGKSGSGGSGGSTGGSGGGGPSAGGAGGAPGAGGVATGGSVGSGGTTMTCNPSACTSYPPCVDRQCSGTSCVETFHDGTACGGGDPCHNQGSCSGGSCQPGAAKPDNTSTSGANFCCGGTEIGPDNPVYCGNCGNNCLNGSLKCCCGASCCSSNPGVGCSSP
jgi:hypothetical protein